MARDACAKKFRRPYLFIPTGNDKPVPFMVPFKNFTYSRKVTQNGNRLPETGIMHPDFNNFSHFGASYDRTYGELTTFHVRNSPDGGISDITFAKKKGQLEHQAQIECYLLQWATDGCMPGLSYLMKGWDMKKLKMRSSRWLKDIDFPHYRNEDYLQTLHYFGKESKSFLVPKGLSLENVDTAFNPYSRVYGSVKEQAKGTVSSFGLVYREEASGAVQGLSKVKSYSQLFAGGSHGSAVAGVNYKLFRARCELSLKLFFKYF